MRTGAACLGAGWVSAVLFALSACGGSAKSGGSSGDGAQAASSGGSGNSSVTSGGSGSSDGGSSGNTTSNASSTTRNGNSSGGSAGDTTSAGGTGGSGGSDDTSIGGGAGSGGSGGGSAGASGGECTLAEDCELFQDCCSCRAVAVGAQQASCRAACDQPACDAQGVSEDDVACLAGRCVINRSCDDRYVECDVATPNCEAGTAPEVLDGCYTGNCREVAQCSLVSSCDVCEAADLNCVTFSDLGGPSYQCVATREGCDPTDCECMGVCTTPFFCGEDGDTLFCSCIAC